MNQEISKIPIYCRIAGNDPEGWALEAQIFGAKSKATAMGLKGEYVIFSDNGVPAMGPMENRKGLIDCLAYITQNKPAHLFVSRRDRFARNSEQYLNITKTITKCNTEIIFFAQDEPSFGCVCFEKMREELITCIAKIESQQIRQEEVPFDPLNTKQEVQKQIVVTKVI